MRKTLIVLVTLAGCATYREMPLSHDHPANPGAAVSPAGSLAQTLELTSSEPVTRPEAAAPDHVTHGGIRHTTPEADTTHAAHGHQAAEPRQEYSTASQPATYVCPMHLDVTSDQPDQRCPKCGMKLVKKPNSGGTP
jgi:hypothetical protein